MGIRATILGLVNLPSMVTILWMVAFLESIGNIRLSVATQHKAAQRHRNSGLQAGIWFGNVAPSPIITIPHSLWLSCPCLKVVFFEHVIMPNVAYISFVKFFFEQCNSCACQGEESSTIFSGNVFDIVFIFVVVIIFEVVFIFEVVLILRSSSFLRLSSFLHDA